ncbi:MAG TPA: aldo/keto reductase [Casimicrobiaceae bacterium]
MSLDAALLRRLRQSRASLGCAPLGNLFHAVDDDEAAALVSHAHAQGARYFDTAPHYGSGLSEHRLGAALRHCLRDEFLLSTKVGRLLVPEPDAPSVQFGYVDALPFVQRFDYTRDGVLRSLDDSLQRLAMSRVDLVYVHDIDKATHGAAFPSRMRDVLDGALPALAALKAEGTIGGFGLGVNDVQICLDTLHHADLDVILLAGRYTLADQSAVAMLLPECVRRGVAVVLGGPFNSGILATGSRPHDGSQPFFNYAQATPAIVERVSGLEDVCREFAVPLRAAALQFPCAHPAIANVLAGARSRAEYDDHRAMQQQAIPDAFWRTLRARRLIDAAAPLPCDMPSANP